MFLLCYVDALKPVTSVSCFKYLLIHGVLRISSYCAILPGMYIYGSWRLTGSPSLAVRMVVPSGVNVTMSGRKPASRKCSQSSQVKSFLTITHSNWGGGIAIAWGERGKGYVTHGDSPK